MSDVLGLIRSLTLSIVTIAWALFLITWIIGWALRGSPIPFYRVKRVGQSLVEDAVWGAFWLAIGSSVFALISYIASQITVPYPEPPPITPQG